MNEMVERVSRAIYSQRIRSRKIYPDGDARFDEAIDRGWMFVADEAKAAIEAMRKGTDQMAFAGADAIAMEMQAPSATKQ